jgi:hypothetical protein
MIILCRIMNQSLLATLSAHTAPSAGVIWKQPIFKMATCLQSCTKVEMQSAIRVLSAGGYLFSLPYSPDLSPCDHHLFWSLKDALRGCQFLPGEQVKMVAHEFNTNHMTSSLEKTRLIQHWRKCVQCNGEYSKD